ncbi:hypothetical protein BC826DRAFT_129341 [Russula brevipes]|nr:hypothetical protein BC826DRAFT_129341 [Russula brevipes]
MAGPLANDMITSRCCHMCRGIQADRRSRHHHFDCLCYFFPLLCLKSFAPLDRFKEDPRHRRPPMSVPRSRSTTEHPVVSVRPTPVHFSPPSTRPPASLSALATRTPQPIDGAPTCDGSSGCRHLMGHWHERGRGGGGQAVGAWMRSRRLGCLLVHVSCDPSTRKLPSCNLDAPHLCLHGDASPAPATYYKQIYWTLTVR